MDNKVTSAPIDSLVKSSTHALDTFDTVRDSTEAVDKLSMTTHFYVKNSVSNSPGEDGSAGTWAMNEEPLCKSRECPCRLPALILVNASGEFLLGNPSEALDSTKNGADHTAKHC